MTGCRLSPSGAQGRFGLTPDMTCLGKIVGGGLPLAAYGGKREIMEKVAPLGPVYQAGTLSGNPVAVSAALATLALLDDALYTRLEAIGARLEAGIRGALVKNNRVGCVQRVGSMITLFFAPGPIQSWNDAAKSDTKAFGVMHASLLAQGIYWPPSQFEAAFLSVALSDADIEAAIVAFENALAA
jgi:glutamate-1-semialdehyde 2,1-aminomutase